MIKVAQVYVDSINLELGFLEIEKTITACNSQEFHEKPFTENF